ncbi:peptide chain release factor PrfB3, chloroplastic isoform X3 [Lycium ferocissimum]|uniref:peptide chain release factor PrfB3, chloroplastic isoform X3 n=1 Tax=Lycium ferocissimum TaxID=112874 RepID=UPI00281604DB|nr:peptide chain release factor PrfB3, chloroplastic isoform X3 [Lycium ferocissimum]
MAKMVTGPFSVLTETTCSSSSPSSFRSSTMTVVALRIRAHNNNQHIDDKSRFYKELGTFALKRKIEDLVLRAEMLAPTALEFEEARRFKQEEIIREYDLWDDVAKSNEDLVQLAESAKAIDSLKDLRYKAEEAKLITELAGMDSINYEFLKQAYAACVNVNKTLDKYEMSKLLREPYDMEGACVTIESGNEGVYSEDGAAAIDVIPLFLESSPDLQIDENDLEITTSPSLTIQHIPTGLQVRSTGERSRFANKLKALNRLKAKLLIVMREQGVSDLASIISSDISSSWNQVARRYVFHPNKLVEDVKTGVQLADLTAVLNGNIEPFIGAHINSRRHEIP